MEGARGKGDCSITENIYYSQMSFVAILLQPEPVSHRIIQGKDCVFSPSVLSSFGLPLPPTCLLLTASEARSYFASTIQCCWARCGADRLGTVQPGSDQANFRAVLQNLSVPETQCCSMTRWRFRHL
jgi:hypothetical protein